MSKKPNIAVAGIGNLGWNLSLKLYERGFDVCQIVTKKTNRRQKFAKRIDADLVENLSELKDKVDLLFICMPDDRITEVISDIKQKDLAIVHCSGYTEMIKHKNNPTGVFYPFQTFTKYFSVDWDGIPIFIESDDKELRKTLRKIGEEISQNVLEMTHEQRKAIHIAGVFGSNFTNHLLYIVKSILDKQKVPFEIMKPLMEETIRKAFDHGPAGAQTGPAKRGDDMVIKAHLEQLKGDKRLKEFYGMFTDSIKSDYIE
ncbi:MAG: DUF2520 domain-containing protein [Flavobacteriales bacterium]